MSQPNATELQTAATRRFPLWWVLAAVVLLIGFIDLARGGTTLAPFLLVIGYCVLIPLAILK
jgi:hypothetical protein